MFTGIIESVGTVRSVSRQPDSVRLTVEAPDLAGDLKRGESVCVSGVCLTVVAFKSDSFEVDLVPETLHRTSLGRLDAGSRVNVERSVRLQDRLGGHLVSGHIDGVGTVSARIAEGEGVRLTIQPPRELQRYLAEKGSICVDGVSLTVAAVTPLGFDVALIPFTLSHTTLAELTEGARVNLEADLIAKYVERLMSPGAVATIGTG